MIIIIILIHLHVDLNYILLTWLHQDIYILLEIPCLIYSSLQPQPVVPFEHCLTIKCRKTLTSYSYFLYTDNAS